MQLHKDKTGCDVLFENPFKQRKIIMQVNYRNLADCLKLILSSIDLAKDKYVKEYFDLYERSNEDERKISEVMNYFKSKFYHFNTPLFIHSSFIVSWYSFIEMELHELCLIHYTTGNYQCGPDYFHRDRGIKRSKKYLEQIVKQDLDHDSWNELFLISDIRNKIVHHGPYFINTLSTLKNELKLYLEHNNLIADVPHKCIWITKEYCEYLLEFGKQILLELYKTKET